MTNGVRLATTYERYRKTTPWTFKHCKGMNMSSEQEARWRDGLFCELGKINQGLKDLGRNFDSWKKVFDGNGQPGRCAIEREAREELARRIQALEDVRKRAAWAIVLLSILKGAGVVVAAALILAFMRHFFHWL
jgi:hypothetical protein